MSEKNALISPLNWGLGHACRIIPLVVLLKKAGYNVIIGGNGRSMQFLKLYFPKYKFVEIKGINIKYGKKKAVNYRLILYTPLILLSIIREKIILKKIIKKEKIDLVVSDNRPGLFSRKIRSIYITHQPNVFLPGFLSVFNLPLTWLHRFFIKKFSDCWIPDFDNDKSLTGKLTNNLSRIKTCVKIGPLSRFSIINEKSEGLDKTIYDFLIILSGPEPQRSALENIVIEKFANTDKKVSVLRGLPESDARLDNYDNISFFNHLSDAEFKDICKNASTIICRSGYSTIMDLAYLERKAVLIPTPGQPEQEYLAKYLQKNFGFKTFSQNQLKNANIESLIFEMSWESDTNNNSDKIITYLKAINL